jgi:hypothetical protein
VKVEMGPRLQNSLPAELVAIILYKLELVGQSSIQRIEGDREHRTVVKELAGAIGQAGLFISTT